MSNLKETIIRPKKVFNFDDILEIWRYRELLYFFVWRDLKVRYKQTAIGVAWAVLQPFVSMVVFSVFFGTLIKVPSDGIPYPIFVYTGLLFWQFFSGSLSDTSNSLISNRSIITKVYFPRIILPIAAIIVQFVDFFVASVVLVFLMFYYGFTPHLVGLFIIPLLLAISPSDATRLASRLLVRALLRDTSTMEARTPIIAITTKSSIRVKPFSCEWNFI
jgi:lipopolysaccharide transport system permease protein